LLLLRVREAVFVPITGNGIVDGCTAILAVPDFGIRREDGDSKSSDVPSLDLAVTSVTSGTVFAISSLYLPLRLLDRPEASELERSREVREGGIDPERVVLILPLRSRLVPLR
jgi:hypothetical protein